MPAPSLDSNVFINCPFDDAYCPILHAITFIVRDAKFVPRTALEATDSGTLQLTKIVKIISECRLSIHDISRIEPTVLPNMSVPMPRFNMPFECGVFYGASQLGTSKHRRKKMLVIDSEPHRARITLSDMGGNPTEAHHNDPLKAIACVRGFLSVESRAHIAGEKYYQDRYQKFMSDLPRIAGELGHTLREINDLRYWRDYVYAVNEWLESNSSAPPAAAVPGSVSAT